MITAWNDRFVSLQATTAVFEACSKERIQPFDDDDEEEEDIWEEKEISFSTQAKSRKRSDPHHDRWVLFQGFFQGWLVFVFFFPQSATFACKVKYQILLKVWWLENVP